MYCILKMIICTILILILICSNHLKKLKRNRQNVVSKIRFEAWAGAQQIFRIPPCPKNEKLIWKQLPAVQRSLKLILNPYRSPVFYNRFRQVVNRAFGAQRMSSTYHAASEKQMAGLEAFVSVVIECKCLGETHIGSGTYLIRNHVSPY